MIHLTGVNNTWPKFFFLGFTESPLNTEFPSNSELSPNTEFSLNSELSSSSEFSPGVSALHTEAVDSKAKNKNSLFTNLFGLSYFGLQKYKIIYNNRSFSFKKARFCQIFFQKLFFGVQIKKEASNLYSAFSFFSAVGITGLEPATSRPPDVCATNCAKSRSFAQHFSA